MSDDVIPRPAVIAFARLMEKMLRAEEETSQGGEPRANFAVRLTRIHSAANAVAGALADTEMVGFTSWEDERRMADAVITACVEVGMRALQMASSVRSLENDERASG